MKNCINPFMIVLAAAVLFTSSCKKDEKKPEEILPGQSCWAITKWETQSTTTLLWVSEVLDNCIIDNCITFSTDGKVTFEEGATKCDPADEQTTQGTWEITDTNALLIVEAGAPTYYTFSETDDTKIVMTGNVGGETIRVTLEAK